VLGVHNDVAVLREHLGDHADALEAGDAAALVRGIDARRDELRRAAEPLGWRLYADRPKAFVRRLEVYWATREPAADPPAQEPSRP
jgi:hypothetical protein